MRCHGIALSGTDSVCYLPLRRLSVPDFSTRRGFSFTPDRNIHLQISKPKFARLPSGCVKAKAAVNDSVVLDATELSFYQVLGVPESGTMMEIKQAYKQMALKYHPDVSPPDRIEEYTRKFIRVQEAYETLSDPGTKALYDRDMAKGLHLAFSARRRRHSHEEMEEKSGWKSHWQEQLSELKRRSVNKDARSNMSWGARMRSRQRESDDELIRNDM